MIGHTQPRRIAARSRRRADRRGARDRRWARPVGYQVRFTDRTSRDTRVKLMTDGILLAELQRDRLLRRYDTIIIDEAHERSLNIDFLLGYLKQLLPRRPDLKLVITSATIDPERFAQHFADRRAAAPIIEVSGRTYPVEVRYRPLVEAARGPTRRARRVVRDQTEAIVDAVQELCAEGPGDILVFLPGEREIRDTADALAELTARPADAFESSRSTPGSRPPSSTGSSHSHSRPPGRARHQRRRDVADRPRHPVRRGHRRGADLAATRSSTKVQRLPIEAISQASANQRSGRCGRVEAGIAIRLYSEEDFECRPEFTDPEILRTNLASVILQMTSLGLGDVGRFPFVDPPDQRNVPAGVQLLEELGALVADGSAGRGTPRLTPLGRRLVALPIDPRLARMILEADRLGCLREVLVIAAALSLQDPRERPAEQQAAGRPAARPLQGRDLRLPDLAEPLALRPHPAARAVLQRVPADVQARSTSTTSGSGSGRTSSPSCGRSPSELKLDGRRARRRAGRRRHPPGAAVRAALPHRAAATPTQRGATSAPGAPGSRSSPGPACSGSSRSS